MRRELGDLHSRRPASPTRGASPHVLTALGLSASLSPSEVLDAVGVLQAANADRRRTCPTVPLGFVPARWLPYLDVAGASGDVTAFRHCCEPRPRGLGTGADDPALLLRASPRLSGAEAPAAPVARRTSPVRGD